MTENHLAKVCRSPKDKFKAEFEKKKRRPYRRPTSKRKDTTNQLTEQSSQQRDTSSDDVDYVVHSFSVFAHYDSFPKDDKYFTWPPVSVNHAKTVKVLMQVDSAATCYTLPSSVYTKLSSVAPLQPSFAKIFPYSGKAIRLIGKVSLACEGPSHFETLEFQVIDSHDIPGKPALISGKDSARLGVITFHKTRVFSSTTTNISSKLHIHLTTTNPSSGDLQKRDLQRLYKDNFEGLGTVGQPVHLTLDPKITPCHAGTHRIPVAKLEKVKKKNLMRWSLVRN